MARAKVPSQRPKVVRNGQIVDRNSTEIRPDQREKLTQDRPPAVREVLESDQVKLITKAPEIVYGTKKNLWCNHCKKNSPTRRMFSYANTSQGPVVLCEFCNADAEVRSFLRLDVLDKHRKKFRIE